MRAPRTTVFLMLVLLQISPAGAGKADVVDMSMSPQADGSYHFDVTVRHADTGWKHYADKWEILAPDGTVLATRTLAHPHVREQPFTRYLDDVRIPADVKKVRLRAHDKVHGFGGKEVIADVPR